MNQLFNYATQELARTARTVDLIRQTSDDDAFEQQAIELLEESQLHQYFELCRFAEADPSLVQVYSQALQRVEVAQIIIDRRKAGAGTSLGVLALETESELGNLESFFQLFAPSNSQWLSYLARKQLTTKVELQDVPDQIPTADTQPTSESIVDEEILSPSPEVTVSLEDEPDLDSPVSKTEFTKGQRERYDTILTPVFGKDSLVGVCDDEKIILVELLTDRYKKLSIRRQTPEGKNQRIEQIRRYLDGEDFADQAESYGVGRGAVRAGVLKALEGVVSRCSETELDGMLKIAREFAEANVIETGEQQATDVIKGTGTEADDEQAVDPTTTVKKTAASREKGPSSEKRTKRTKDPTTKLLPGGYTINRRFTSYSELERILVDLINSAPRKQPYSPQHLCSRAQGLDIQTTPQEIDSTLKTLQGKLPDGWLVKVSSGRDKPDGWRLGKGVRISRQHGRKV